MTKQALTIWLRIVLQLQAMQVIAADSSRHTVGTGKRK